MHHPHLSLRGAFRGALLILALASMPGAEAPPSDAGVPLEIDVRSAVDQGWAGLRKRGAVTHSKRYLLAAISEVPSAEKMARPVDPGALAAHLRQELARHGFREITAQEIPEVVLTVTYGRGFLRNPHLEDAMLDDATTGVPTATITSPKQAMRQRGFNAEARLQKAQFEKLYLAVTAWKYPEARGEKPHFFWRTVMAVDNPDGRDLNLALPAMLAAGAGYFDREIKDPEVTINSTLPTGTVKLGPLDVIEERTGK